MVFGAGSFNAESAATRWDAFYAPGGRYALKLQSEWGRLRHARKDTTAAGLATTIRSALDASASAFVHKAAKLHMAISNATRPYWGLALHARACELARDNPRRRAFLGAAEDKIPLQLFTGTPMSCLI